MTATHQTTGAALTGLFVVMLFVYWLTGAASAWWAFASVVETFVVLALAGAPRLEDGGDTA